MWHAGHLVYHGPRENVLDFFEPLGFRCPERKGVADFLQEVTSRKDQQVSLHVFSVLFNSVLPSIGISSPLQRNEATALCDTCRAAPSSCVILAMEVSADGEGLCVAAAILVGPQQAVQVHQRG